MAKELVLNVDFVIRTRLKRGLATSELAERAGISLGAYERLEREGNQGVQLRTVGKLAAALSVVPATLLTWEDVD